MIACGLYKNCMHKFFLTKIVEVTITKFFDNPAPELNGKYQIIF